MTTSARWLIALQVGAFFGYISFGWIADRIGRRPAFTFFMIAATLLVPLFAFYARTPMLLLTLGPLLGFFAHGYFSLFGAMLAELFPDAHPRQRAGLLLQRRPPRLGRGTIRHRRRDEDTQLRDRHRLRCFVLPPRCGAGLAAAGDERSGVVIDLSADLGEGAPDEPEIWPLITSANVACGGHYGDAESMSHAVRRARELGTRVGAHPSYPDRENFGRKSMSMPPEALRATLIEQITALRDIAGTLHHVKPHGALYNDAHKDRALAEIVIDSIRAVDPALPIVCSDSSQMAAAARAAGTPVIREAFADRRYNADGSLVARSEPRSLLDVAEAAAQAAMLANEGAVIARDGTRITVPFDTICIHADMEHAVARLRAIRQNLGGAA